MSVSSFPALFFSELLIPGLRSKYHKSDNIYTKKEVMSQLKLSIDQCSSDEYFIINQPGLQLQDFAKFQNFGFLRAYMSKASSIQSVPNVLTNDEEALDLDFLNEYIERKCEAQTYKVVNDQQDEVPHYIDTKKRVIQIDFSDLPREEPERSEVLAAHDEVLKQILQRLPSPHYFILLTTNRVRAYNYSSNKKLNIYEEFPEELDSVDRLTEKQRKLLFENSIFPDITIFDKTRTLEVERNPNPHKEKSRASFPKPRLSNTKLAEHKRFNHYEDKIDDTPPSLIDYELLRENLVVVLVPILALVVYSTYKLVSFSLSTVKLIASKPKTD